MNRDVIYMKVLLLVKFGPLTRGLPPIKEFEYVIKCEKGMEECIQGTILSDASQDGGGGGVCIRMQPLLHPTLSLAIFNCVLIILQRSLGGVHFLKGGNLLRSTKNVAPCISPDILRAVF